MTGERWIVLVRLVEERGIGDKKARKWSDEWKKERRKEERKGGRNVIDKRRRIEEDKIDMDKRYEDWNKKEWLDEKRFLYCSVLWSTTILRSNSYRLERYKKIDI